MKMHGAGFAQLTILALVFAVAQSCANNASTDYLPKSKSSSSASSAGEASLNQYSVNSADRSGDLTQLSGLRSKLDSLEKNVLAPADEDENAYPAYSVSDATDRGLIRLMDTTGLLSTIGGGGAYYSFVNLTHELTSNPDLELSGSQFKTGFADTDYGFFGALGNVSLDQVTLDSSGVSYAASYTPPTGQSLSAVEAEAQKFQAGVSEGGLQYISTVDAQVGSSYVLRSIQYGHSDVLVAFQVVRMDGTDGSMILIWKLLKTNTAPTISQSNPAHSP
jgi:hypothetical protein